MVKLKKTKQTISCHLHTVVLHNCLQLVAPPWRVDAAFPNDMPEGGNTSLTFELYLQCNAATRQFVESAPELLTPVIPEQALLSSSVHAR